MPTSALLLLTYMESKVELVRQLLNFIDEQISLARSDPAQHQPSAVVVCADAIKVLKRQLAPDAFAVTQAMLLTSDTIYNEIWISEWLTLADKDPSTFSAEAAKLIEGVRRLRQHFA